MVEIRTSDSRDQIKKNTLNQCVISAVILQSYQNAMNTFVDIYQ